MLFLVVFQADKRRLGRVDEATTQLELQMMRVISHERHGKQGIINSQMSLI
jgi:hypothetical protein